MAIEKLTAQQHAERIGASPAAAPKAAPKFPAKLDPSEATELVGPREKQAAEKLLPLVAPDLVDLFATMKGTPQELFGADKIGLLVTEAKQRCAAAGQLADGDKVNSVITKSFYNWLVRRVTAMHRNVGVQLQQTHDTKIQARLETKYTQMTEALEAVHQA